MHIHVICTYIILYIYKVKLATVVEANPNSYYTDM